jgi:chemotaxis protein MotA
MFAIIGIVVVFGCVLGGYLMEHGHVRVLMQPAELLIIGGAAAGTVLIANPLHILKQIVSGIIGVFTGSKFTKQRYLDTLKMVYDLLNKARREGLMALEGDVEEPDKSPVLSKYPSFVKDHHIRDYFCDTCAWPLAEWKPSILINCSTWIWKSTISPPASPSPR